MTGADHYRAAELLLLDCQVLPATANDPATYPEHEDGQNTVGNALAAAQVHATLALAAATALGVEDRDAWTDAASACSTAKEKSDGSVGAHHDQLGLARLIAQRDSYYFARDRVLALAERLQSGGGDLQRSIANSIREAAVLGGPQ